MSIYLKTLRIYIGKTDNKMIPVKEYIAKQFIDKTFRFKCDCIIAFDVIGHVKDYEIAGNEIILLVNVNNKIMHIGLNTSMLQIEQL